MIAINSSLDMNAKQLKTNVNAEILSVTLTLKNSKKLCITTCYRVGTLQDRNFNEISNHIYNISSNKAITKHILIGDFNLDTVNWNDICTNNSLHRKFLTLFEDNCLTQLLHSPTHYRGNLLDLVLTDAPQIIKNIYIADHDKFVKSDHYAVNFA